MSRAPRLIVFALVGGASLWALAIALASGEPFAVDSGTLVGAALVLFSVIVAAGLLLARGRWARNLARALLAVELAVATVTPLRGWTLAALAATALGIVGIQGRWLDGWLRRLPSAAGPGTKPIVFMLGSLALPLVAGAACPDGLDPTHHVLWVAGVVIGTAYSRAQLWALWTARLAYLPVAIGAALTAPPVGAALLVAAGAGLTRLAWDAEVRSTVSPLLDELPGPRRLGPRRESAE